ncbi:Restriction endonuclease S subunit [Chelatococcus sambhunathii]|uniref:Restriction endonuclease S subunit n=1 Tax=Chelatococcus sambhunathii TaxID=363953 RepID=A0ABM9U8Q9_9HYPH|nr:restriction endonuclease subunit S [Chelatococcus sambhunathii]CUA90375.1 Restriction endonuclease S subunit [Chelatococcus sambhunathii]
MAQPSQVRTYHPAESAVFLKTNERFGGLSNMAPGFPIVLNGVRIRTSEALYQACRFPRRPDVQRQIIDDPSPMTAKMRSKPFRSDTRPDWDAVRVKIMRWCLRVKLAQNWQTFGKLLLSTADMPIVEKKVRRKDFWGATEQPDGTLVGMNVLGRLLMELREQLKGDEAESLRFIEPLAIPDFLLLGEPIEAVQAPNNAQIPGWAARRSPAPVAAPPPSDPQPSLFEQPMITNAQPAPVSSPPDRRRDNQEPKQQLLCRPSGHDWLGDLPSQWDVLRSKYLFREIDDRTDTGTETLLSMRQAHGLIPHAKVSTKPVTPEELKGYKRVCTGQMVMNRMQASNGMFAVAREDGLVSPDYAVFQPLRPMEPDYFVELFKTNIYRAKFRQESKGLGTGTSGFLRLYSDRFGSIHVPQPPESEQRKIVQFIRAYDVRVRRLIRNKRRLIGLLNEQKQAIINRAVTRGLNPDAPMKPTGIDWMPEVPAHWEVKPLKWFLTAIVGGSTPPSGQEDCWDGDIVWVTPEDISRNARLSSSRRTITQKGLSACSTSLVPPGSVVITSRAPVGNVSIAEVELATNQGCKALVPNAEAIDTQFLFELMRILKPELQSLATGTTFTEISTSRLGRVKVGAPSVAEQKTVIDWVRNETRDLERAIEKAGQEIALINEYRERLIADVVTGKLDVRHIEIVAPADEPIADEDDSLDDVLEDGDAEAMEGADADD